MIFKPFTKLLSHQQSYGIKKNHSRLKVTIIRVEKFLNLLKNIIIYFERKLKL